MKVLITSDLHLHSHRRSAVCIEDGLQCLEWIYKVAEDHKVDRVIFAGDFLHDRFFLNTYAYAKACHQIMGGKTIMLLGNHDMYYENRWDVHSLVSLRNSQVTIIDKPCTLKFGNANIDFLPYTPEPSKYLDSFKPVSPVLISHLPVAGAILNNKYGTKSVEDDSKDKEILPITAFNKWKKVYLGHYHYAQKVSASVEYLGSPMQLSFGEAGQRKRVVILDLETLHAEDVENTFSPLFHIIEDVKEIDKLRIKDSYVEIRLPSNLAAKFDLRKKLTEMGARDIEFVPPKIDMAAQTEKALKQIAGVMDNKDQLIDSFVDGCKDVAGLDRDKLKAKGKYIVLQCK